MQTEHDIINVADDIMRGVSAFLEYFGTCPYPTELIIHKYCPPYLFRYSYDEIVEATNFLFRCGLLALKE